MPTQANLDNPQTFPQHVGRWIRTRRQELSWSQIDLCRQLGRQGFELPQTSLSRWERGLSVPGLVEWVQLCRTLYTNPSDALARVLQAQTESAPLFASRRNHA